MAHPNKLSQRKNGMVPASMRLPREVNDRVAVFTAMRLKQVANPGFYAFADALRELLWLGLRVADGAHAGVDQLEDPTKE